MDSANVIAITAAVIGPTMTLLGVAWTQIRADRREDRRIAAEERREQARVGAETARVAAATFFEHRRAAYAELIERYHFWADVSADIRNGIEPRPDEDALRDLWRVVSVIELFGSRETAEAARDLHQEVYDMVLNENPGEHADVVLLAAYEKFMEAARADLGVRMPDPDYPVAYPPIILRSD